MSATDPFGKWLKLKDVQDKALELLGQLDNKRGGTEEPLVEVGVSLKAVDIMLEVI